MNFGVKKGHFNLDQTSFFAEIVKELQPEYILETGFCTGRSASSILTISKNLKKIISIDINFDYIKPEGRIYKKKLEDNFENFTTIENNSREILNNNFFKKELFYELTGLLLMAIILMKDVYLIYTLETLKWDKNL